MNITKDSGQISIDFLVGFTIFIIGFIFVITMMSGLLVGLQSKTIDYDAVAYRTGVILVEDPGQVQKDTPENKWEFLDPAYKDDIIRLGLAISPDFPNILTRAKVDRFFDSDYFSYPDDYRRMLIFGGAGTYPYNFNISLDYGTSPPLSIGDSVPDGQSYGYIKRAVFIKEPPGEAVFTCPGNPERIDININFPDLYDTEREPIYNIDPLNEEIRIRILTDPNVELTDVSLLKSDADGIYISVPGLNLPPVETSGGPAPPYPITVIEDPLNPGMGYVKIIFPQRYFSPFSDKSSKFLLSFSFDTANYPPNQYNYDYSTDFQPSPTLTPAILEVCIW